MKKFINQFSAGLKNNILVFLAFPFVWTSCARDNSLSSENSNISPNAAVRAAVTGTTKANIKLFSFTEVNDTNPLNNLNFTLKNSGNHWWIWLFCFLLISITMLLLIKFL